MHRAAIHLGLLRNSNLGQPERVRLKTYPAHINQTGGAVLTACPP